MLKINGRRKKAITKQIYQLWPKFNNFEGMKHKIIKDELDKGSGFDFGYYEGRYVTKCWILQNEDIRQIYLN